MSRPSFSDDVSQRPRKKKKKKNLPTRYLIFSAAQVNSLTIKGIGSAHKGRFLTKKKINKLEGKERPSELRLRLRCFHSLPACRGVTV